MNGGAVIGRILTTLLGLALALFGAWLLHREISLGVHAHTQHIWAFVGMIAFGMLIIVPTTVFDRVKQIVVIVVERMPEIRIGGKRKYDPPAPRPGPAKPPADDVP